MIILVVTFLAVTFLVVMFLVVTFLVASLLGPSLIFLAGAIPLVYLSFLSLKNFIRNLNRGIENKMILWVSVDKQGQKMSFWDL